jgi:ribosomal protein L37AE/L43A
MNQVKQHHHCRNCGDEVHLKRWALGYKFCLPCGDELAKARNASRCVVPLNKSNYMLVTDLTLLKQLNPKRTT